MTNAKVLSKQNVLALTTFIVLVAVAVIAPIFKIQYITGPIVNATIILSVALLGFENAVFVSLLPSPIALSVGLLPVVLLPMTPFIIIGNVIFAFVFSKFKTKDYWLGITLGAALKFLFIFLSAEFLIKMILKKELAEAVMAMMSWPQVVTALAGGVIAFGVLKIVKKKN